MRCKSCDHILWNLPGNTCPECGTEFARRSYEFQPYAVIFKCPHCEQPYYGAGEKGHLVPSEFECQCCHQSITMDSCVLVPVPGREHDAVAVGVPVPWTTDAGIVKRFWDTCVAALFSPRVLGIAISAHEPRLKSALAFFAVVVGLSTCVSFICLAGQSLVTVVALGAAGGPSSGGSLPVSTLIATQLGPGLVMGLVTPLLYGLYIPLAAAIATLVFRMFGGDGRDESVARNKSMSFARAVEILLWSSGSLLVSLVPCVGSIASIWWIISAVFMTSAFVASRASPAASSRSAWAMLLGMLSPIFLACGVGAVVAYFVFSSAMSGISGSSTSGGGVTTFSSSSSFGSSPSPALTEPPDLAPPNPQP